MNRSRRAQIHAESAQLDRLAKTMARHLIFNQATHIIAEVNLQIGVMGARPYRVDADTVIAQNNGQITGEDIHASLGRIVSSV